MGTPLLWIGFNVFVLLMLALDLGVFHRRPHAISLREATAWSVLWVLVALAFNLGLLHWYGKKAALEFFTGYVIERSLSMDNIFVFVLLFRYFAVEPRYQHRVLFWGIFGALVMRGAMIVLGVALIRRFEWLLYVFGAFLVYAGLRMMLRKEEHVHPERNPILRWARRVIPMTQGHEGQKLFVRIGRVWHATPLFLVLLVLETTDLVFALDSIPAVFAITRDPFIVYTSNIFAILGLRAFYFLLAGVLPYFRYLDEGLSIVLMFVGAKMLGEHWLPIPTHISLAIVAGILAVAIAASIVAARAKARGEKKAAAHRLRREAKAREADPAHLAARIHRLADPDPATRESAARALYAHALELSRPAIDRWLADAELARLLLYEREGAAGPAPEATAGIAVQPETFEQIRRANGSPPLAEVPADQDAREFTLLFSHGVQLDVLTTKTVGGAIARFLEKFGEGIQQVEFLTRDVDRATALLRERFGQPAIYPQTCGGADATRVNFFLAEAPGNRKVLLELVELPEEPPSTPGE